MKAWWESPPPVSIGENFYFLWARQGIALEALESKKTVFTVNYNGFFNAENKERVLEIVKSLGGQVINEAIHTSKGRSEVSRSIAWPNGFASLQMSSMTQYFNFILETTNEELIESTKPLSEFMEISEAVVRTSSVFMLGNTQHGLRTFNLGPGGVALERGNYTKSVLKVYDRIVEDMSSPTPAGRLGILTGPPGTGKTYLLRGLIEKVNALFVLLPSQLVSSLDDPAIVPSLLEIRENNPSDWPIILVLEDADASLLPRMMDNISGISTVLNATSGMVGDLIDLRIVATTNSNKTEVDAALLRKGRLSGHVKVERLDPEQQEKILLRLIPNSRPVLIPSEDATLAEVYTMARELGWIPPTQERMYGYMQNVEKPVTPYTELNRSLL